MIKQDYLPLRFGLDEQSGKQDPKPGHLLAVENFELQFGQTGLRRCPGYERTDGRDLASTAVYYNLQFYAGVLAVVVGNIVTGPSGSGVVLRVQLNSGAWSGTAAGMLILAATTGTFVQGDALTVSAVPVATAGV